MQKYKIELNYPFTLINLFLIVIIPWIIYIEYHNKISFFILIISNVYVAFNIIYAFTYRFTYDYNLNEIAENRFGIAFDRISLNKVKKIKYTISRDNVVNRFGFISKDLTNVTFIWDEKEKTIQIRIDLSELFERISQANKNIEIENIPLKKIIRKYMADNYIIKDAKTTKKIGVIAVLVVLSFLLFWVLFIYLTTGDISGLLKYPFIY